jgi:hypothetical protein
MPGVHYAEDFPLFGDGVTDDQDGLQVAFDAAAGGVLVFSDASKRYAIGDGVGVLRGAGEELTIRANTRIVNSGATFVIRSNRRNESSGISAIMVDPGVRADLLRIEVDRGFTVNRVVTLGRSEDEGEELINRTSIDRIEINAYEQQTNRPEIATSNVHGALHINGDDTTIGHVQVTHFDCAVVVYDSKHVTISSIDIRRSLVGLQIRDSQFVQVLSGVIRERPDYEWDHWWTDFDAELDPETGDPTHRPKLVGYDGVQMFSSSDVVISNLTIHEAVEHGIYMSKPHTDPDVVEVAEAINDRITLSNIVIRRPGRGGVKLGFGANSRGRWIHINGLTVVDCCWDVLDPERGPQLNNTDGLRMQFCDHVTVDGFQLTKQNRNASANFGMLIDRCRYVTVNGAHIQDPWMHGIRIVDDWGDDQAIRGGPAPVNSIYLNNPVILFDDPEGDTPEKDDYHGIWIWSRHAEHPLRDIRVVGCYIRGQTGFGVLIEGGDHVVRQPIILDGWVKGGGRGSFQGHIDRDVHNYLKEV